jgi:hypothetical protein
MASVVAVHSVELEAAGNSTNTFGLLKYYGVCDTCPLEFKRRTHPSGACSQDHHLLLDPVYRSWRPRSAHGIQRVGAVVRIARF